MKLRIKGNSIRLRLLRSEVAEFAATALLQESVNFGESKLRYILRQVDSSEEISARFADNELIVFVPVKQAKIWTETDLVSLTGEQKTENGEILKILVEKDFVCLDRPNDPDNKDAYPNTSHKC